MRRARVVLPLVVGGVLALGGGAVLVSCSSDSGADSGSGATRSAGAGAGPGAAAGAGAGSEVGPGRTAGAPLLRVVDPYIPQPASPDVAAGYLVVENHGDTADRLVSLSSPLSGEVMLHRTTAGSMEHLAALEIPAGGRGVLARGGNHIMFMAPKQQLRKGDTVDLTLTFERSGTVTVRVPVLGLTERPGDTGVPAGQVVATLTPGAAGVPGTPGVPGVPGTPGVPGVPGVPGASAVPGSPTAPAAPGGHGGH